MDINNNNQNGCLLQDVADKHVFKVSNYIKLLDLTHLLKCSGSEIICEFGCIDGSLIELRYRNKVAPSRYIGLCNDEKITTAVKTTWGDLPWVNLVTAKLTDGGDDYSAFINIGADAVVAPNVPVNLTVVDFLHYLQNFYLSGHQDAVYTLRLPKSTDLLSEQHIVSVINTYFEVINKFGMGGSITDFIPVMSGNQLQMFEGLKTYYSLEMVSAYMSPLFPELCPQHLWKLKRKSTF